MAMVVRNNIRGRSASAIRQRLEERRERTRAMRLAKSRKAEKPDDFMSYGESDEEDDESVVNESRYLRTSFSFLDYIRSREMDLNEIREVDPEFPTRHILSHEMVKEHQITLSNMNKIFCSQWLSHRQLMFGTKCNQLVAYDVMTRNAATIPLLESRREVSTNAPAEEANGIYAIAINPSRTLLATGAKTSNEIGVYRLPTMDPVCLAENAHGERVFDMCWLDDQFLVSCSRDNKMALWKISDDYEETLAETPQHAHISALAVRTCRAAQRVRALAFNQEYREVAALSLNGFVHVFNIDNFKQTHSKKLPCSQDNACMAVRQGGSLYAIGCRSCTLLLDPRTLHQVKKIVAKFSGCGIRSVSFQGDIITMGTGVGMVMFYDLRAGKYMESSLNSSRTVSLKSSRGIVYPEEEMEGILQLNYTPAIYTHCYDFSGTRLFVAGGPLPSNLYGNYAGIWQ